VIVPLARKVRAALDVAVALRAVGRARRTVSEQPVGALVGRDGPQPIAQAPTALAAADAHCASRWGAAVDRALRWSSGDSTCLVRARALQEVVVFRGLPRAVVRIGVRRGADGFEAHAWVEQDGTPIAEPVMLQGAFASLDGVTLR